MSASMAKELRRATFWVAGGERVEGWHDGSGVPRFDKFQLPDALSALRSAGHWVSLHDDGSVVVVSPGRGPTCVTPNADGMWMLAGFPWQSEATCTCRNLYRYGSVVRGRILDRQCQLHGDPWTPPIKAV